MLTSIVFICLLYHRYCAYATSFSWFLGCRPLFQAISCSIDVILPDIPNTFQIWSTLANYEELIGEFGPIRNGEIS